MLIPNPDALPLSLQESIEIGLEQLDMLSEQGDFMDRLMSPDQNLFWEYPGHYDYPGCLGWHPLGTA